VLLGEQVFFAAAALQPQIVALVEELPGAVAARAEPGQRPGALVGTETSVVVKIYEVDTIGNVVEFTGPKGVNRRIKVSDPKAREFLRTLKKGDEVEVRYREAMAVSVEPAK
jgi:hypothetical protein